MERRIPSQSKRSKQIWPAIRLCPVCRQSNGASFIPIEGYEGIYSIDSHGNIISHERRSITYTSGRTNQSHSIPETLRVPSVKNGYYFVWLYKDGKRRQEYVHRLVAKTFLKNPNSYKYIDHKDRDRKNNCKSNLRWTTQSVNTMNRVCSGVYFNKQRNKWHARIKVDGKVKHLGFFEKKEDGEEKYKKEKSIHVHSW